MEVTLLVVDWGGIRGQMDILGDAHEIHKAAVPMKNFTSAHHCRAGQEDHIQVRRVNNFLRGGPA